MKFSIRRQPLLASIQEVNHAISPRTAVVPILTGMKLTLDEEVLTLTGSNSDITIESTIPKQVEEENIISIEETGSIVLPIPHFSDIIRKLPGDLVEIEVQENYKTIIKAEQSVFELHGQSSEEYPHIIINKSEPHFSVEASKLKQLIRQTAFAVSTMETRPILTGVHMTIHGNDVRFTATDTHRLAQSQVPIEKYTDAIDEMSIVVPGQSLHELNKIIDDQDGKISLSIMQNQVLFFTERKAFISRLLSGTYPDTERLIPTNLNTTLHIPTNEFIRTIDRAALLASAEQNNVVRFEAKGDGTIEISSNSPEIGRVNEQMTILSHEGDEVNISFSSRYLLDTLRTIGSEEIMISFTGPMNPFVIKTPASDKILHLILPVRTH